MAFQSLQEKVAFFEAMEALDSLSDGEDQVGIEERDHRARSRAFFKPAEKAKPLSQPSQLARDGTAFHRPRRAVSAPSPSTTAPPPDVIKATPTAQKPAGRALGRLGRTPLGTVSFIEETPVPDSNRHIVASLRRMATMPLPAVSSALVDQSPSMSSALRKRKRKQSTIAVPESDRIFRDLSFFYIPNNDIAPARKLRIGRAQEYGAKWVRELSLATHVVVDKRLEHKDIQPVLGAAPAPSLVIVNEDYPLECIQFRNLLNPHQHQYRVLGCPSQPVPSESAPSPLPSRDEELSLPLKEPLPGSRRHGHASRNVTPPLSAESSVQNGANVSNPQADIGLNNSEDTRNPVIISAQAQFVGHGLQTGGSVSGLPQTLGTGTETSAQDELSNYIELMQKYKDLPLDADEDEPQPSEGGQQAISEQEVESGSDSNDRVRKKQSSRPGRPGGKKDIAFADRFACNHGGTKETAGEDQNPNARTIDVLQSMLDYYSRIGDQWRTLAYRKAISTLRRQTVKITTEEEAYLLPNIGRRLAMKIEEIVNTNNLRRLDYANEEPLDQALQTFLKIYDVGTSRASKWVSQGFRTLEDLKERADLTANQRIGIEHYDDLNTRIPRHEVAALGEYVKKTARDLDPAVELLIGGSYRRGSDSSGDIDLIVTKKGTTSASELLPFLMGLVDVLTKRGFLVAELAALHSHRPGKDRPGSKWHGCCVLPPGELAINNNDDNGAETAPRRAPIWRRIDFLLVPESEYGAALIYFTGNDVFNRSIRLLASKKGMRLNQRGLYAEVMRGRDRARVTDGQLLEGRDERRIFDILGVKWREPWERWC
ncbi:hypothetical protein B0T24DRAFT_602777 [Lasiosphaeria ovina]|uniref:DNA polymerase lambda n=1 Tax=Lasiosphaeria ovina TaxID=92902 RepID=A0AAE0TX64_9PEZI|nr:hypothetical protein B0T24DRAFT_602777 [Lasiosphaeria ovina]